MAGEPLRELKGEWGETVLLRFESFVNERLYLLEKQEEASQDDNVEEPEAVLMARRRVFILTTQGEVCRFTIAGRTLTR